MDSATVLDQADEAPEARTGFAPWTRAELPEPPRPKGLGWLSVVGPGVIVLGVAIGSGEFLLGPTAFVRHGLSLLWITLVAVFLQTVLNTELMRYTAATGEPVFTGFMRTRPAGMWVWVYALFFILQVGWPAWAATSAGALFFVLSGRMASAADASTIYLIGVGAFIACAGLLLIGRRIARTLELLNWILVTTILGAFLVLAALARSGTDVGGGGRRALRLRQRRRRVQLHSRGRRFLSARRPGGVFRLRRHPQCHIVELGARQGVWNGGARRLHCLRRGRSEGEPGA